MGKNQKGFGGLVYSTDPNFKPFEEDEEVVETLPKNQQKLRLQEESKHRAGKTVTVVRGFIGKNEDLETLGKWLKTKCGTGGTVKDGEIIIQGHYKIKVLALLQQEGYTLTK